MDNSNFDICIAKLSESIFKQDKRWQYNTFLLYRFNSVGFGFYGTSYKDTADYLVEHATRIGQDFVVYPIMFLYRHYIELRLKEMLYLLQKLQNMQVNEYKEHNILKLWKKTIATLQNTSNGDYYRECSPIVFDTIRDRLEEFNKLDPRSLSFRYPTDFDNPEFAEERKTLFNLQQAKEVMGEIAKFLDGYTYGLDAFLEMKEEYEAAMRLEYGY